MKTITLRFEDKTYEKIKRKKDRANVTWEAFIIKLSTYFNNYKEVKS